MLFLKIPIITLATLLYVLSTSGATPPDTSRAAAAKPARFDTLSGKLPSLISAGNGPHVVVADIFVPQGKIVTIEQGAVFLFAGFTGLKVQGTLFAQGSAEHPVVFTSVNDKRYNPAAALQAAPYDWNGISVLQEGVGSTLAHCITSYSVAGVNSLTKYIRIESCRFHDNGRGNVTIEGKEQIVTDSAFDYALVITAPGATNAAALTALLDPRAPRRNLFRYAGLGTGLAGGITAAVFIARFGDSYRHFNQLNGTDPNNLAAHTSADWRAARNSATTDEWLMIASIMVAAAGAGGLCWSFTF
ncbi:MAG: hypothetical protein PHC61_09085 [Chitinivibrionales bacterium]|nr:hypothetical protein [Chitinivibrionales bacterium]